MASDVKLFFRGLLAIYVSSVEKMSIWDLFIIELLEFHVYSRDKSFIKYIICKYFFLFGVRSFYFLDNVLWSVEV